MGALLSLFFIIILPHADAESINLKLQPIKGPVQGPYLDHTIVISLSNSCLASIKLNNTTCPSNDILRQLDTSKSQSGVFTTIDTITQRKQNNLENEERLYSFEDNNIIVDGSFRLQIKFKTIYIVPSLDHFLDKTNLTKQNNTRIVYKDLNVDEKCRVATMSAKDWKKTLPHAISYLRSNCNDKFIMLEYRDVILDQITEFDITTSQKYKEDEWKDNLKKTHKDYQLGNDTTLNRSVYEDRDPKYVPPSTPPFDYSKYR